MIYEKRGANTRWTGGREGGEKADSSQSRRWSPVFHFTRGNPTVPDCRDAPNTFPLRVMATETTDMNRIVTNPSSAMRFGWYNSRQSNCVTG